MKKYVVLIMALLCTGLTEAMKRQEYKETQVKKTSNKKMKSEHTLSETDVALMVAAGKGDLAQVTTLLAAGAYVNARDIGGATPLLHAVISKNSDVITQSTIIKALLNAGADPSIKDFYGHTALELAALSRQYLFALELLRFHAPGGDDFFQVEGKDGFIADGVFCQALILMAKDFPFSALKKHIEEAVQVFKRDSQGNKRLANYLALAFTQVTKDAFFYLIKMGAQIPAEWLLQQSTKEKLTNFFLSAACDGKVKVLESCVKAGIPINYVHLDTGYTALMFAAENGHAEAVKALIKLGADITLHNNKDHDVLYETIDALFSTEVTGRIGHHKEVLQVLVKAGAVFRSSEREGVTAEQKKRNDTMTNAILQGDKATIKRLLDEGFADDESLLSFTAFGAGSGQCEPLLLACLMGNADIVQELLTHRGNFDFEEDLYSFDELIDILAANGNIEVIELLLNWYNQNNAENITISEGALYYALRNKHIELVKKLAPNCAWGSRLNIRELAILTKQKSIVRQLIEAGVDVCQQYNFHYSVIAKNLEIVALLTKDALVCNLLNKFYDVDELTDTLTNSKVFKNVFLGEGSFAPLQLAHRVRSPELVHFLQACTDENLKGYLQNPEAYAKGYLAQCSSLQTIVQNKYGQTVLMWACIFNHKSIVQLLLNQLPVCLHAVDSYGRTALVYAIQCGNTEIVSLLLDAYERENSKKAYEDKRVSSINKFDREGNNALCYAVIKGDLSFIVRLLSAGACPTAQAIKLAAEHGHKELALKLLALMSEYARIANLPMKGQEFPKLY